ncbi:MAG: type II toxin-antitoxin system Phd/YefM family antitoxin [Sphingomonas adhaesiva]|uniref:type II toxin-antitoxin system Phd/YefM family antitoxin n=1 Tax=Sphingomonas adhaesiva TaxID=28212 RepID=UPI002FF89569
MGKTIGITEFKAKCIALLDEMERSGEPLTITRRGKPSLTLSAKAAEEAVAKPLFGAMKGTFMIHGDIVGPVDPDWEVEWERKWDERGFVAPARDGA